MELEREGNACVDESTWSTSDGNDEIRCLRDQMHPMVGELAVRIEDREAPSVLQCLFSEEASLGGNHWSVGRCGSWVDG